MVSPVLQLAHAACLPPPHAAVSVRACPLLKPLRARAPVRTTPPLGHCARVPQHTPAASLRPLTCTHAFPMRLGRQVPQPNIPRAVES